MTLEQRATERLRGVSRGRFVMRGRRPPRIDQFRAAETRSGGREETTLWALAISQPLDTLASGLSLMPTAADRDTSSPARWRRTTSSDS